MGIDDGSDDLTPIRKIVKESHPLEDVVKQLETYKDKHKEDGCKHFIDNVYSEIEDDIDVPYAAYSFGFEAAWQFITLTLLNSKAYREQ